MLKLESMAAFIAVAEGGSMDIGAEAEGATLHIAYPYDRRRSAKLRALTEWLRDAFGDPPYWDTPPTKG